MQSFYQVMEITQAPVIASHSSCRTFTPGFVRNMDDEMLKKLAVNGGVIQINFGSSFLDGEIQKKYDGAFAASAKYAQENNLNPGDQKLDEREAGPRNGPGHDSDGRPLRTAGGRESGRPEVFSGRMIR